MKKYEVIIIGAGPSGISTALSLKKLGINDILIIDKSKFPRYKCCAGYITNKTKKEYMKFGLDVNKCHYTLIDDFKIIYNNKPVQIIKNKFLYTNKNIDRVELDYNFFKLLGNAKIECLENTTIKSIDNEKRIIKFNNNREFKYENIVFADGTSGYGSQYNPIKFKNIAMQAIVQSDIPDSIDIHFGITKMGYAWISSKDGLTNIGITDLYNKKIDYSKILMDFAKRKNINISSKDIQGAFTPASTGKAIIGNAYYVGDAVGGCDPLTLSGLRYGINSGKVVAETIYYKDKKIYLNYIRKLKNKFFIMRILQRIFYLKFIQFLIFRVGCVIFKPIISFAFNYFFVNKK